MPTNTKEYMRSYGYEDRHSNPVKYMVHKAKKNAKKSGLPFDLDHNELKMPEFCPVLGIPLQIGNKDRTHNSPSLDRFDSNKGYTADNVNIISWRANHLKNNGTAEEHRRIADWMEANIASVA